MFKLIDRYEENGLGLPYPIVLLDGAEQEVDADTGEVVGVAVPDLEQLVTAVALVRVLHPRSLAGVEVRFLRTVLGMASGALAEELTLDKATLSRWENGKQSCGEWADKLLRQVVVIKLADQARGLSIDPTMVVGLRTQKGVPGEWPQITMRRVLLRSGGGDPAWDAAQLAVAA